MFRLTRRLGGGRGGDALRCALAAWVTGRVVVVIALALAHYLVGHLHPGPLVALRAHQGLLGWDAGYYRDIAGQGYAALPRAALRFFPLLPLVVRALHYLMHLPLGYSLLIVTNGCALAGGVVLYRLVEKETGDTRLASAATWMLALAPSSFVLVMGYAEAPMILLAGVAFTGLRSRRWWVAGVAGYLAGLTRPLGVLLVLPAGLEVLRNRGTGAIAGRLWAVSAPGLGALSYLGWVAWRFGDFWAPVKVQESGNLRGHWADPLATGARDAHQLLHGHIGTGLHVPWAVVFVGLLLVTLRRWPLSYGLFAGAVLALAMASSNFDSLERYALSAFPLVLAAAGLLVSEARQRAALPVLGSLLGGYALLAFLNAYVP